MKANFEQQLQSFPSPFVRAILHDKYDKGHSKFSVTQLIGRPQRTWLATQGERIETPYSSFSALLGTAIHSILEEYVDPAQGEIAEKRLYIDIDGITVSGQIDFYEHNTIFDYKSTRGVQDKMKEDHFKQVTMNGYLARQNGMEVQNVGVVYIQMDWSYMQSTINPSYPQSPFAIFIHPYEEAQAIKWFGITVAEHMQASMGAPRPCTDEEMWAKPDTFALMKPGAKRANKVCDSLVEAQELQKPGQIIQTRKGERTFCGSFCGYQNICPQHQAYLRESSNQEEP